jgi:hypothetical protein
MMESMTLAAGLKTRLQIWWSLTCEHSRSHIESLSKTVEMASKMMKLNGLRSASASINSMTHVYHQTAKIRTSIVQDNTSTNVRMVESPIIVIGMKKLVTMKTPMTSIG